MPDRIDREELRLLRQYISKPLETWSIEDAQQAMALTAKLVARFDNDTAMFRELEHAGDGQKCLWCEETKPGHDDCRLAYRLEMSR
jgi:hypothetical protein